MSTANQGYCAKLTSFSCNPKLLFYHLRYLSMSTPMPKCLINNSTPSFKDKVEAFSSYFSTTFTINDCKLPPTHHMPTPLRQINHIMMDESDVFKALIQLNPSKAQGWDNISPYVLEYCTTSWHHQLQNFSQLFLLRDIYLKNGNCIKLAPFLKRVISRMYQTVALYLCFIAYQKFYDLNCNDSAMRVLACTQCHALRVQGARGPGKECGRVLMHVEDPCS